MKKLNTITISFKESEVEYLIKFKSMYAVPTAIIKDFIINTVKGNINVCSNDENIKNSAESKNSIDLFDF